MAQSYVPEKEVRQQYEVGAGEVDPGNRLGDPGLTRKGFITIHLGNISHSNLRLRECNTQLTELLDHFLGEEVDTDGEPPPQPSPQPVSVASCITVALETEARLMDMSLNRLAVLIKRVEEL